MTDSASYPAPKPHGELEEPTEGVFWVQGSVRMNPIIGFSRNMTVIKDGDDLTVVNAVRLSAAGEATLDRLGTVKHVVRLGSFHGLDDRYYVDHYNAEFWCQADSRHYKEPTPTQTLAEGAALPIAGAEICEFHDAKRPECVLLVKRGGGILITCDSFQNWANRGRITMVARVVMPMMGFKKTLIVGPLWLKFMTPEDDTLQADFERVLEFEFDQLVGAHGGPWRSGAREKAKAAVTKAFSKYGNS